MPKQGNFKGFILFVLLVSIKYSVFAQAQHPNYSNIYSNDYKAALLILKNNKLLLEKTISDKVCDTSIIISTIFPELLRYSLFKDMIETAFLEHIYLNMELDAVDFSIGLCQIKPSFVHQLEDAVRSDSVFYQKYGTLLPNKHWPEKQKRKLRLENLKKLKIQIEYVCCFSDIVNRKFPQVQQLSKTEKIRFFATAYNIGFSNSYPYLCQMQFLRCFPYGCKYGSTYQYSYADIAVDFYCNHYYQTFK